MSGPLQRRDEAEATDMTARSVGVFEASPSGTVSDEQFETIRSFMDPGAKVDKSDIYGFRMIACGDGVDAYYTRQHPERSLATMARDLSRGQAVLGNHDYGTFSYGSSYTGEVIDADALSSAYEGVFYPQHDRPEYRTTKWLVGDYFIPRNLTLNGQSTNDLIRAMEMGAVRKASITFAVGSYECALDGKDLLMGFEALFADPDEVECRHFPGIAYEGSLCYAWMKDTTLLETSMVYKNASPSSMLLRKAEEMASRGMIPAREITRLEERIGQRLPRPERHVFAGAATRSQEEPDVTTPKRETPAQPQGNPDGDTTDAPQAPAPGEGTDTTGDTSGNTGGGDAGGTTPSGGEADGTNNEGGEPARTPVSDFVSATEAVVAHFSSGQQSDDDLVAVAEAQRTIEEALETAGSEDSVGQGVARQYEARERMVRDALGEEPTVEVIRNLTERATLGDELYKEAVEQAVQERTRALGEHANPDAYRTMLMGARSVEFVKAEATAYGSIASKSLAPQRQVTPREPTETKAPKAAPSEPRDAGREQSNILARNREK